MCLLFFHQLQHRWRHTDNSTNGGTPAKPVVMAAPRQQQLWRHTDNITNGGTIAKAAVVAAQRWQHNIVGDGLIVQH